MAVMVQAHAYLLEGVAAAEVDLVIGVKFTCRLMFP
jgi:hypothetical protein